MNIFDDYNRYLQKNIYPFHMPGHKRQNPCFRYDFTEVEGTDNLYYPNGIIGESITRIEKLFETKKSYILVNGSTTGILTAITACANKGDKALVARNCHKSVYNTLEIWDLQPFYVVPKYNGDFYGEINPKDVEEILTLNPDIKVCVITSPTYEGVVSDVKAIANVCHRHNVILIVDEAHGSHMKFGEYFPKSAVDCGADVVIHSTHKTLGSLTGTGLLHICSDRVDVGKIEKRLKTFQTSSPNYIMIGSVDKAVCDILEKGENLFDEYTEKLEDFYNQTANLEKIKIFKGENVFDFDRGKLIISVKDTNISGVELQDILREKYLIETEMASSHYVIAMTSIYDTKEGFSRLINALREIDKTLIYKESEKTEDNLHIPPFVTKASNAEGVKGELVKFENAVGRISKEYIFCYPPGSPIVVPGEKFTKGTVKIITEYCKKGVNIVSDSNKLPFSVVCAIDT